MSRTLREELRDFIIFHRRGDDAVLSVFPVRRRGDFVLRGELQRVDDSEDFQKVASGRCGIGEREFDFLVRADDEDGTHRECGIRIGMDHVVEHGDVALGVSDDREVHRARLSFVDVTNPALMGCERVDTDGDALDVAFIELGLQASGSSEFGCADRCEIRRMREENSPAGSQPLVEIDGTLRRLCCEIRSRITQSQCHISVVS